MPNTLAMPRPLWMIFLVFDALLIVLFVAGYTASYVHPRHLWWLQGIGVSLPYLSLLVLLVTIGLAWCGEWKLLSLHGLICVLIVIRFMAFDLSSPRTTSEVLTVMTFNAKYTARQSSLENDAIMKALLQKAQPQLIGLQEEVIHYPKDGTRVHYKSNMTPLLLHVGYTTQWPEVPDTRYTHPVFLKNITTDAVTQLPLPGMFGNLPQTLTRTSLHWQGQEIAIYNVQLHSFSAKPWQVDDTPNQSLLGLLRKYRQDFLIRAREAEQVRRILAQETRPFILFGDFNSTPHNWTYRHIAKGLQDVFKLAGRGWGATYHTQLPFARIDYILTSNHWNVHSAYVGHVNFSDHLPLVSNLSMRKQ